MTDEDLRRMFEGAVGEIRRHFDVTAERLEKHIDVIAEGVVRLDQKFDRTAAEIRDEMRRGFADTRR
jgi:DNA-binding ferritin-like protein